MIKLLCILLSIGCGIVAKSQSYLLYQGNNESLILSDITTRQFTILSKDAFGRLVGYEIKEDTLFCHFEIRGKLRIENEKLRMRDM